MKTKQITIKAELTEKLTLRLFILNSYRNEEGSICSLDERSNSDHYLEDNTDYTDPVKVLEIIRKVTRNKKKDRWIRDGWNLVIAYQILNATEIIDNREEFGHRNQVTLEDEKMLTEKIFIYGTPVSQARLNEISDWVMEQCKLKPKKCDTAGFKKRDVSYFTPDAVWRISNQEKGELILKIGKATFAVLKNKENFRPQEMIVSS